MKDTVTSDYCTLRQAAVRLNVSTKTIERLASDGEIDLVKIRSKKQITRESLEQYQYNLLIDNREKSHCRKKSMESTKDQTPSTTGRRSLTRGAKELGDLLNV